MPGDLNLWTKSPHFTNVLYNYISNYVKLLIVKAAKFCSHDAHNQQVKICLDPLAESNNYKMNIYELHSVC